MTPATVAIAFLAFVIGMVAREFLPGYFRRKGENLATKEDVAEITRMQKEVEHRFNELIENSKQRHAFRLAAIDRRLAAHQEAFSLWRELMANTHGENVGPVVLKCQAWWEMNCLYLEPSVRDAFVRSYSAAHSHHAYTQGRVDATTIQRNWQDVTSFPNVLFEAIQLPPITQADVEGVISK